MRSTIARLLRRTEGVAALEFGLLVPSFVMLFAGTINIGYAMYMQTELDSAVAAGTNYALISASNVNSGSGATLASTIATLVSTANGGTAADATVVVNNGPTVTITSGTPVSSGTASNADACYCPTGSPSAWTWGSAVTCGASCTGGGTGGKFVSVTASYSYAPFLAVYTFGLGSTLTIGSIVQTQ